MAFEHLLCVDDENIVLQSLKHEIKTDPFFKNIIIDVAETAEDAIGLAREISEAGDTIPVIISDQRMPVMSGSELLGQLHASYPDTKKILLTGYSDLSAVTELVNRDALYRYLAKPWDSKDLLLSLREAFRTFRQHRQIGELNTKIESMTLAMVSALESTNFFFDEDTGNHIRRISSISGFIARKAGFNETFVKMIKLYAPLHDIGKVGISKEILLKPARLDPKEFEQVKEHVRIGHRIIDDESIDPMAKNIVLYHHEKWNGGGYLEDLSGDRIPVEARIVSIADVYDALTSPRVYKPAIGREESIEIIREERGKSFDPELLDAFLSGMDKPNWPCDE